MSGEAMGFYQHAGNTSDKPKEPKNPTLLDRIDEQNKTQTPLIVVPEGIPDDELVTIQKSIEHVVGQASFAAGDVVFRTDGGFYAEITYYVQDEETPEKLSTPKDVRYSTDLDAARALKEEMLKVERFKIIYSASDVEVGSVSSEGGSEATVVQGFDNL